MFEFLRYIYDNHPNLCIAVIGYILALPPLIIFILTIVWWVGLRKQQRGDEYARKHNEDKESPFVYKIHSGWLGQTLKPILKPDQKELFEFKKTVEVLQKDQKAGLVERCPAQLNFPFPCKEEPNENEYAG